MQRLRRIELLLRGLAPRELALVVLREVHAALALLLLTRQIRDELRDELAAGLPQAPQLIEHQRAVGGLGRPSRPSSALSISCTRCVAPSCCLIRSLRRNVSSCRPP